MIAVMPEPAPLPHDPATPDGLPPLRTVVARHNLWPKKALGQNFLFDFNLTLKIARAAGDVTGATVFEIGAGPGGLTRALLACGARHVVAIERDLRALEALGELGAHFQGRLTLLNADALGVDWQALSAQYPRPIKICANLPYNIATPLLVSWLSFEPWPPFYQNLTLMFQKEVAERIVATPSQRAQYGRLAVLCAARCDASILFDVPASAFVPPPKVTSSLVQIAPRVRHGSTNTVGTDIDPPLVTIAALEALTRAAFGNRRKMLRQSLKHLRWRDPQGNAQGFEERCAITGIDPTRRAEDLSVPEFIALSMHLVCQNKEDEGTVG